ncbi:MAG: hypothetical protein ACRDRX_04400 [Pseudonocardiaceae bacterium]
MAVQTPLFLQKTGADPDITYSATNYRLALIAALCQYPGVLDPYGSNGLLVTQRGAGANFSVDIAAGYGIITGGDVALQGAYIAVNDATVNVATPSAPGSGTRVHRVVLQIRDKLNNGAYTTYDGVLQVLQDTGSGTPATPASAISLAKVSISAGQANVSNAHITDDRAWARWALGVRADLAGDGAWTEPDATRPLTIQRTPDGLVKLYGWTQRTSASFAVVAGTNYRIATGIPSYAVPTGNRDIACITSLGPAALLVQPTGEVFVRFNFAGTINIGDWVSLDGASYRIGA